MFDIYNPPKGSFVISFSRCGSVEVWPYVTVEIDRLFGTAIARTLGGAFPLNAWCARDDEEATDPNRPYLHALVVPDTEGPPPGSDAAAFYSGYGTYDGRDFVDRKTAYSCRIAKDHLRHWTKDTVNNWRKRNSLPEIDPQFPTSLERHDADLLT